MNVSEGARQVLAGAANFTTILIVLVIIVGAGLLGGWAAYLAARHEAENSDTSNLRASRARFLLMGCIASACVPLFLSLVQSNLVQNIFTAAGGQPFEQYLVFLGLCLVSALSARTFLESVSRRVLRDLEDVKERQQNIQQQVEETAELIDEQSAEPLPQQAEETVSETNLVDAPSLDDTELRALQAMTKLTFRTATGIASDTGVPRSRIGEILDSLSSKGLVALTPSPTTKGPRWRITPAGILAVKGRSSQAQ